jgi:hypothetical protein
MAESVCMQSNFNRYIYISYIKCISSCFIGSALTVTKQIYGELGVDGGCECGAADVLNVKVVVKNLCLFDQLKC